VIKPGVGVVRGFRDAWQDCARRAPIRGFAWVPVGGPDGIGRVQPGRFACRQAREARARTDGDLVITRASRSPSQVRGAAVTLKAGQNWIVASMVRWRDWLMFSDLASCPMATKAGRDHEGRPDGWAAAGPHRPLHRSPVP
jgi:hypothetical protein